MLIFCLKIVFPFSFRILWLKFSTHVARTASYGPPASGLQPVYTAFMFMVGSVSLSVKLLQQDGSMTGGWCWDSSWLSSSISPSLSVPYELGSNLPLAPSRANCMLICTNKVFLLASQYCYVKMLPTSADWSSKKGHEKPDLWPYIRGKIVEARVLSGWKVCRMNRELRNEGDAMPGRW